VRHRRADENPDGCGECRHPHVHLPDQDGRVVFLELRERYPVLPVIMLTGDVGVRQHALHSGAFAFIVTPYTTTEQLEILCRATGRTERL
jgi:FixJ family two-component response regulator